eukprot:scaffold26321_cov30-Prasinocladus_malaysianus.AAC.2
MSEQLAPVVRSWRMVAGLVLADVWDAKRGHGLRPLPVWHEAVRLPVAGQGPGEDGEPHIPQPQQQPPGRRQGEALSSAIVERTATIACMEPTYSS